MESFIDLLTPTEIELTWWKVAALLAAGVLGGFINTVAGGASMITVPLLILLGMPADYANGTNRVGILQQSIVAIAGFNRRGKLDKSAVLPMLAPTVVGAVLGALAASWLDPGVLKPVLLGTIVTIAVVMLVFPDAITPPEGAPTYKLTDRPIGLVLLFVAGLYGGFVQAGVGFMLIAALAVGLRYDLVRTNALKVVCTALFSIASLAVFIATDHVEWLPGIILAAGMTVGALACIRFALNVSRTVIKWTVFVIVCLTSGAILLLPNV